MHPAIGHHIMFGKVKRLFWRSLATVNIIVVAALCISGYSGYVSPITHGYIAISGLAFPIILAVNLAFLVFWILFHWRLAFIPIIGLIICYLPIRQFCPFNFKKEAPADCIKVISYNVHLYGTYDKPSRFRTEILDFFRESDADIICVQESLYKRHKDNKKNEDIRLLTCLSDVYPYVQLTNIDTSRSSHYLYSKHPILEKKIIPYESDGNMSEAYLLLVNGDSVLLVNNHLETYGLSPEDKEDYQRITEGEMSEARNGNGLLSKIIASTRKRAAEAEAVHNYIERHNSIPVIVCGDFNDTPLSYTHHTICRGLTDTYVATGNGPGFSYTRNNMFERIDHIFCSSDFEPYNCYVDSKLKQSDHNPIICLLKKRPKH